MRVLAISGSLRAGSSNTTVLEAASRLSPVGMSVTRYPSIAALPHFNPDDDSPDSRDLPAAAAELRKLVGEADALLISTPEYAHGLPGAFKNALDWLVGSVTFPGKPVMLMFGSSASVHAPASLREILRTMSAVLVPEADVTVELRGKSPIAEDVAADHDIAQAIRGGLDAFVRRIEQVRGSP